jgi:rhodanese-related sulfurtransferase
MNYDCLRSLLYQFYIILNLVDWRYEMGKSAKQLLEEAKSSINVISVEEATRLVGDESIVFVDVRDANSIETVIPGAISVPRGMLEFHADPEFEAFHKPELDPSKHIVFTCGAGGQAALSGKTLKEMGFENISSIDGGMGAWEEANGPTEEFKG